jgi:hypothetical protein
MSQLSLLSLNGEGLSRPVSGVSDSSFLLSSLISHRFATLASKPKPAGAMIGNPDWTYQHCTIPGSDGQSLCREGVYRIWWKLALGVDERGKSERKTIGLAAREGVETKLRNNG